MKTPRLVLIILSLAGMSHARAQSFSFGDLFGQQGKKEKLMTAQVGSICLYLDALKSGYRIMEHGLNLAHDLKGSTFSLHAAYFHSLEQVNPVVRQNPKGKAITDIYYEMNKCLASEIGWQKQQRSLNPMELTYLEKVSGNLIDLAVKDLGELNDLLTPGKFRLTDQQRLDRLEKLYETMKDKAAFAASFTGKCRVIALNRQRAKTANEQLRKLYNIP